MNENELFEAIGETDDKLIIESERKKSAFSRVKWAALGAAGIAVCIAAGTLIPNDSIPVLEGTATSEATTPPAEQTSVSGTKVSTTTPPDEDTLTVLTTSSSEYITSQTTASSEEGEATANSLIHLPNQTVTTAETTELTTVDTTTAETTELTTVDTTTVDTTTAETTTTETTTPKITTTVTLNDVLFQDEEVIFPAFSEDTEAKAAVLRAAAYPEMPVYPDENLDYEIFDRQYEEWSEFKKKYHYKRPQDYKASMKAFTQETMNTFLTGSGGNNVLYSPMNMYFAMGMFAEITDGNSRQQVLDLLGAPDIESLRDYSNIMWESNYCNDGAITSIFANSLWLNDGLEYNEDTLGILSDRYYASSFSGEMGSAGYTMALRKWLDEQTGGLLTEETNNIHLRPTTVISQASTLYFKGMWDWKFRKDLTAPAPFITADGEEISCDYMYMCSQDTYYYGEGYSAVAMSFAAYDNAKMWLILPDEGVTPDELITNGTAIDLISKKYREIENKKYLMVHKYIPKFDASMSFDMIKGMKKMGVTDVFDSAASDYSPLSEALQGISVSQANHSVRVVIDEEGCTAAAFTVISSDGAAMPPDDEVEFRLNRPFIFAVTGISNDPLFVGVINNPNV